MENQVVIEGYLSTIQTEDPYTIVLEHKVGTSSRKVTLPIRVPARLYDSIIPTVAPGQLLKVHGRLSSRIGQLSSFSIIAENIGLVY